MSEIFNDKTTAEIDAKLHRDILKHNLNIENILKYQAAHCVYLCLPPANENPAHRL